MLDVVVKEKELRNQREVPSHEEDAKKRDFKNKSDKLTVRTRAATYICCWVTGQ